MTSNESIPMWLLDTVISIFHPHIIKYSSPPFQKCHDFTCFIELGCYGKRNFSLTIIGLQIFANFNSKPNRSDKQIGQRKILRKYFHIFHSVNNAYVFTSVWRLSYLHWWTVKSFTFLNNNYWDSKPFFNDSYLIITFYFVLFED